MAVPCLPRDVPGEFLAVRVAPNRRDVDPCRLPHMQRDGTEREVLWLRYLLTPDEQDHEARRRWVERAVPPLDDHAPELKLNIAS
jgi:hypothetical protein